MISWLLIAAETAAMFAIPWLLEGKDCQRPVMLGFAGLSVVVGCVALSLAQEPYALMRILCLMVPLFTCFRLQKNQKYAYPLESAWLSHRESCHGLRS